MEIAFDGAAFSVGCAGALCHEALRWIGLRTDDRLPDYLRKLHYWVLTGVLVLIGGALATVLAPTTLVQALWFGVAAPSILSRLGTLVPTVETLGPEMFSNTHEVSLRDFLRG